MILLLGYLGSLLLTFAVSVVALSAFLGLVPQKAMTHPRPIPLIQEPTFAPAIGASKKQATVASDGARSRDAAGEKTEKPRRKIKYALIKQRPYARRHNDGEYPLAPGIFHPTARLLRTVVGTAQRRGIHLAVC
jgi:hypothetical protein